MGSPILSEIDAAVTKAKGAQASAAALIRGFSARLQAAIAAALENGATAEELAPIQDEVNALNASSDDLAAAVAENP